LGEVAKEVAQDFNGIFGKLDVLAFFLFLKMA
jgi:hypothetical protein